MANPHIFTLLYMLLFPASFMPCFSQEKKVYVVYMGEKPRGDMLVASLHNSILQSVLGSPESVKKSLIYSYVRSFNGFAAELADEEVERISGVEGVVSVFPNEVLKLHTTRSWDFLGLTQSNLKDHNGGGDVIIGMFDSGIWPESDSFSDEGFGPPPRKWKGKCYTNRNFTCNNKIIGARYYNIENYISKKDIPSPRDSEGHGSHTASIAAGREVARASYFGIAEGLARGGFPNARIAVYKVCWEYGCRYADILAAFDDAIADGVDIISVSLGSSFTTKYFRDPIAIGAFHAMRNGILTSSSAGNNGPYRGSLSNYAPWLLTVAANSIDRKFVSKLVLGNGDTFPGNAINTFNLNGTYFPLAWAGDAANYSDNYDSSYSRYCASSETMNSHKIKGKIILCEHLSDGSAIKKLDGIGVIMPSRVPSDVSYSFPLPASTVSREEIERVWAYIKSYKDPKATIQYGETLKDLMAPTVASFSSRGPNIISPDILKPDLTAPGIDIIAAYSPLAPASSYFNDNRSVEYKIISGTSMSCPHVSGAAAYVKATHPGWSPAAIKSALMTTASVIDPEKHREDKEFAYGSGQLNPVKAIDPGMVFDLSVADYINFLCKQGYNNSILRLVTGDHSVCRSTRHGGGWDLNYPSLSLAIADGQKIKGIFTRTVTNVGSANSTYYASINVPKILKVVVVPSVLSFSTVGESRSFTVEVSGPEISQAPIISGSITWNDGLHVVRTPLVAYTILPSTILKKTLQQTRKSTQRGSSVFKGN